MASTTFPFMIFFFQQKVRRYIQGGREDLPAGVLTELADVSESDNRGRLIRV